LLVRPKLRPVMEPPVTTNRSIIHLDLDTFFVSVERLRNKRLHGLPLIIGGRSERGVVAACSYEARRFGIQAGMALKLARQLCPDALVIAGDMEQYAYYSNLITSLIQQDAPVFEKASIDEFYLDVSGMDRYFGCFQWGAELRQRIIKETGLPLSMGLSVNKVVAKVATGQGKPNGCLQVQKGTEKLFLAPLPVRKLPMAGPKTARFLEEMGVYKIGTLAQMPAEMLQSAFGKNGLLLWKRANGQDNSPVEPYTAQKSIGTECTFETDTIDVKHMRHALTAMVEELGHKLRQQQKLTACVTVKLRYANFDTETKQLRLPYTASDKQLLEAAQRLFKKLYQRRMLIRLLGVRFSHLVQGSPQMHLFDETQEEVQLYQAMDHIKYKFGSQAVLRATSLHLDKRLKHQKAHVA